MLNQRAVLGPEAVGLELGPVAHEWTERDAMLYALGIGAGLPDDLDYLYEGRGPAVVPTFALTAVTRMLPPLVDALAIDLRRLLHVSQHLDIHRIPAAAGSCTVTRRVTGVWDKGRAVILDCEDAVMDAGGRLATARSSWWVADAGGFGGPRSPAAVPADTTLPEREPELRRTIATRPEQAALYRLSGDRNPVHIDPAFAREAGQPHAFLHGLCTFGALAHALHRAAGPDRRLRAIGGRFTSPVFPGDELDVVAWWTGASSAAAQVHAGERAVLGPVRAAFEPCRERRGGRP